MTEGQVLDPVVVLGGGLTGISAARHLGTGWVLFDKEARLGGHARTDERDGFHFDKTGHWLHLRDPYTQNLVRDLLPGGMVPVERRAKIFSSGVLTRYPFQANLHGLPPEIVAECLMGAIEAQTRFWEGDPRDFADYCLRHFGAGISRHFMIPYNRKLWGVDPSEITSAWCSRFVPIPKLPDIVAGAVGANPPEMGYNTHFLYPRTGGIETMTRALVGGLTGGEVRTGCALEALDWKARRVSAGGETMGYRAVVATIPLPELLSRMHELPPAVEQAAARLRCTPVRYLNVALKRSPDVDYHWIYVPEERYPFYRVGIYTNAVPSMAPPGRGSLYVELSDRGPMPALDETLRQVVPGLIAAGAMREPDDLLFAEIKELRYAYVVFDHHYYAAVGAILPFLESAGIYPRGRYGSWVYNSMEDCILAGREVARLIHERHAS